MEYMACDRETIEKGLPVRTAYLVISITDPGKRKAKLKRPGQCRGVLLLRFHDAEPTPGFSMPPEIRLFSPKQARQIAKFVDEHRGDVGTIVVQCEQGMSRSPAVAAAICEALGDDSASIWSTYQPNRFVYELLQKTMAQADAAKAPIQTNRRVRSS